MNAAQETPLLMLWPALPRFAPRIYDSEQEHEKEKRYWEKASDSWLLASARGLFGLFLLGSFASYSVLSLDDSAPRFRSPIISFPVCPPWAPPTPPHAAGVPLNRKSN